MYNWKEDKALVKLFDNNDLFVRIKDMSLVRVGMETTYSGGVVTKVTYNGRSMWRVLKDRSRRLEMNIQDIAKIPLLKDTFRNSPNRTGHLLMEYLPDGTDPRWGSPLRVLNPSVLERTFFGTYSTNMDFLTNLYVFLLKNPKYEGVNTYEIVHLTLQERIEERQAPSRAVEHQENQVGWEPISTKSIKGGLKLGEFHLYGFGTGPKHLKQSVHNWYSFQ
jgi:hypothetical protein